MPRRGDWSWSAVIVASALSIAVMTIGGFTGPIRSCLAIWFLFVCPGMALVRLLRLDDFAAELTLALALSLALDAIVAVAMVYARIWSPTLGLAALIGVSVIGVLLQFAIAPRYRSTAR